MNNYDYIYKIFCTVCKYILPIVFIFNNLSNLISINIFLKKSWKKNVCVLYFKFFLLFDTFYLNTFFLSQTLSYTFNIFIPNFNTTVCRITQYTFYLFYTLVPNTLVCASIDRILISSQNVHTRSYSSKRLAFFLLSVSTVLWTISYIHLPIKSSVQAIESDQWICTFDLSEPYISFVYYSLAGINFIGCSLIFVLCILSFKNVRKIRLFPSHQRHGIRSMTKKDFQLLRCLYVQDVIYIIFSILTTTYDAYGLGTENQRITSFEKSRHTFLTELFSILGMIPYVSSFWIFLSISKTFRHEIKQFLRRIFVKNTIVLRGEEEHIQNNNIISQNE